MTRTTGAAAAGAPAVQSSTDARLAEITREYDQLAYAISHDLRAPLRAIEGFSTALAEDYGGGLDETARDYIARILAANRRLRALLDGVLALSRANRQELRVTRVEVSPAAREAVSELAGREPDRTVDFRCPDGIAITADPRLTGVLLRLLLDNAWKFTRSRPDAQIEVGGETGNGFFVSDNGIGLDLQRAIREDLLFVPFQVLHSEAEGAGAGMGLAIARRIVQRQGGRIEVASEVGKGTTVRALFS